MSIITCKPLTPDIWEDFEKLFGDNGADGGCWCMFFRMKGKDFQKRRGEGTKQDMQLLVEKNKEPGILAYVDGEPAGWCSLAPRIEFTRINNSHILKKVDEQEVWSIVCFFIDRKFRKQRLSEKLLEYSISYAKGRGAKIIESYPRTDKNKSDDHMYVGVYSTFEKFGFKEIIRRSSNRPIMRLNLI